MRAAARALAVRQGEALKKFGDFAVTRWRGGALLAALLGTIAVEATASTFILPDANDGLVGEPVALKVTYEDRFSTLAMKYDLGFEELRHANPDVDPWIPGEGARVVLPTQFMLPPGPREGIVINLPEYRLFYFPKGKGTVMTFPIGIGRTGFQTPAATTKVVAKITNPSWYPTKAHREEHAEMGDVLPTVVPPGPDNPLGDLAIQLTLPGYFLHGTNKPFGVGQRVSHGCVRLYPVDIHSLSDAVPIGMQVRIIDAPVKVAWHDGVLWMEAHPPLEGEPDMAKMTQIINRAIDGKSVTIDWTRAEEMARTSTGMPGPISTQKAIQEPMMQSAQQSAALN
jgi:L,D-transpeptidase ErfK/SrfK